MTRLQLRSHMPRWVRCVVAASLPAAALAGCSARQPLPQGTFAGSTAANAAIVIVIGGSSVKVDGRPGRTRSDGTIEVDKLPGAPRLRCSPRAKGEELSCDVRRGDDHEMIELVRT